MRNWLKVAGFFIGSIGVITLPDDLGAWGDRISDVWGMVESNPPAAFAIVLGLVLLGAAYKDNIGRLFGAKRWRSDKELGEELHGWLRNAQYQLVDIKPEDVMLPAGATLVFGFIATELITNRPVTVLKVSGEPGVLLLVRVIPSDEKNHRKIIEGMSEGQRSAMLEDVGLELARTGLGFDAQDLLGKGIQIMHGFIPSDMMTVHQFMAQVGQVVRATLVVQMVVTRHVRLADAEAPVVASSTVVPQLLQSQEAEAT